MDTAPSVHLIIVDLTALMDTDDRAIRRADALQWLSVVNAIGAFDAEHLVMIDFHVPRTVVAEDASIPVRACDVMDIVIPDYEGTVVCPDIDCPRIYQHPGGLPPEFFRHADFVVFQNSVALRGRRICMPDTGADCGI